MALDFVLDSSNYDLDLEEEGKDESDPLDDKQMDAFRFGKVDIDFMVKWFHLNPDRRQELYLMALYVPLKNCYFKEMLIENGKEVLNSKIVFENIVLGIMKDFEHNQGLSEKDLYKHLELYANKPSVYEQINFGNGYRDRFDPCNLIMGTVLHLTDAMVISQKREDQKKSEKKKEIDDGFFR